MYILCNIYDFNLPLVGRRSCFDDITAYKICMKSSRLLAVCNNHMFQVYGYFPTFFDDFKKISFKEYVKYRILQ